MIRSDGELPTGNGRKNLSELLKLAGAQGPKNEKAAALVCAAAVSRI